MKLAILVLCIFTVCYGATSRLKTHQVYNEEEIVENIPGSSYQLNTVQEEESVVAPPPLGSAPPAQTEELVISPVVENQPYEAISSPPEDFPILEDSVAGYPAGGVDENIVMHTEETVINPIDYAVANEEAIFIPGVENPTDYPIRVEENIVIHTEETVINPTDYAVANEESIFIPGVENPTDYPIRVEENIVIHTEETVINPTDYPVYHEEAILVINEESNPSDYPVVVTNEETTLAGGYTDVPLNQFDQDQNLQDAARVCIEAVLDAAKKDGKLESGADFQLRAVNKIQSQVVAGTNYAFDVVLGTDADAAARIYATFTAFSQPWTNTLTCTEGCVKIGRMVRV